jgi:Short C-terminal domain
MPGLLRGVARTAVIAGTASAVSGRVQRRQAERFADRDAQIYAQRSQAYEQATAPAPPPPAPPAAAPPPEADRSAAIAQLQQLAELKAQGILTDDEFAAEKARILGA